MLFAYDIAQLHELEAERQKAMRLPSITLVGVKPENFRHAVRVLMNHDKLIVPTSIEHCTPIVERFRAVALQCGITVQNLTAHLSETHHQPAAAAAVPPAQRNAVAG